MELEQQAFLLDSYEVMLQWKWLQICEEGEIRGSQGNSQEGISLQGIYQWRQIRTLLDNQRN